MFRNAISTPRVVVMLAAFVVLPASTRAASNPCNLLGEIFSASPFDTTLQVKGDNSADIQAVPFSNTTQFERVNVDRTQAGAFDPKTFQTGDRICVQTGNRILVMRRADIQQQQKRILSGIAQNSSFGTITQLNAASHTITVNESENNGTSRSMTVLAGAPAVFRQFSPEAQTGADAHPGSWEQMHVGDRIYVEGTRNADTQALRAGVIILGGVRGVAGTIVAINGQGVVDLLDLRSGFPISVEVRTDSVFRVSPFLDEVAAHPPAERTTAWNLHTIGIADLQKGDSVSTLVKAGADLQKTPAKTAGLMIVTGFGYFGTDVPPAGPPVVWLLDPLQPVH